MPIDDVKPLAPEELPVPFGIEADTGASVPGLTEADLERIDPDAREVLELGAPGATDHLAIADIDPNNLEEAGWCVVFAKDADPSVKRALEPLLKHREAQVLGGGGGGGTGGGAGKPLFRVFEGDAGYQAGDDARKWTERHGAGLSIVDPERGVPLYVLLVGSPTDIPFEFQYMLDLYWNVGRLHFDTTEEYAAYAEGVVAYETGATVPHKKRAAIFAVKNPGDRATGLLHKHVAEPIATGSSGVRTLAGFKGFQLTSLLADAATKVALTDLLRGPDAPAFLFTGSHGVKFKMDDPEQRQKQGALLCQDWPGFGTPTPDQLFTATDVPDDANVHGLIHFLFACYGGGCPKEDNFGLGKNEAPKALMPAPVVARLPQRLLAKGALASFAHVDRAWAYSFQNGRGAPQVQGMRDVMVRLMQGQRVGQATDDFNMQWAVLSAELQESQDLRRSFGDQMVSSATLANRWVARNDARNYVILGDPAVRLRTDVMAG